MPFGRLLGMILVVLGGFFALLASSMLGGAGVTLKLFVIGPGLLAAGLAMCILPGAPITVAEYTQRKLELKDFIGPTPTAHKVAWVVAGIVGQLVIGRLLHLTF